MNTMRMVGSIAGLGFVLLLLWTSPVSAQTFSSGSTGALGALNPTSNTQIILPADGVLNYTTINIPAGVLIAFTPNAANTPVAMLATGDVTISGTIFVNGFAGANTNQSGTVTVNQGGQGGPGGFAGGSSGMLGQTNNTGSYGQGPGGGSPTAEGTYGAPTTFVGLIPLFGGSGGGGVGSTATVTGASGGGGGGAIVIASTTRITVASTGIISANGGDGGVRALQGQSSAGGGSGGAVRLVAPQITSTGTIRAQGGLISFLPQPGSDGRIRLEAVSFGTVATTTPAASTSSTLGPITANSTPALINLPTLTINSVGGIAAPATPTGSYTTADVSLPTGTTNPVAVTLTAMNIPLSTVFTMEVIPQFATASFFNSTASAGSFASATATASVTLPSGVVSVLNAFASFTLTASLFPLIDGEEVDRVMLAATYGEPSTTTVITKSGKEVRVDRLPVKDQLAFAKGWEAMQKAKE